MKLIALILLLIICSFSNTNASLSNLINGNIPSNSKRIAIDPYLTLSISVNDSLGNHNHQADFGEYISLDVTLHNTGPTDVYNLKTILSHTEIGISYSDPYLQINDNSEIFGFIGANNSSTHINAFSVLISNNIPDAHVANFNLHINDSSGQTWTLPFSFIVNAPLIEISKITIVDPYPFGNDNGRLDPGETVTVSVLSINRGHFNATNAIGTLFTFIPNINIANGTVKIGNIDIGDTVITYHPVSISPFMPFGSIVSLDYNLTYDNYVSSQTLVQRIGAQVEDWESNTFSENPWVQNGEENWTIAGGGVQYEGNYCAKSGIINNSSYSSISVTKNCTYNNDIIEFYKKVSSEEGYDFLNFYIDGAKLGEWSGTHDNWSYVHFHVTPGTHTFKWEYKKDYSVSSGSDCAWIDYIVFPVAISWKTQINEHTTNKPALNCYPNPFNDYTTLSYTLDKPSKVSLIIYNSIGKVIDELTDENEQKDGIYNIVFHKNNLCSGIYYCVLSTGAQVSVRKIVIYE